MSKSKATLIGFSAVVLWALLALFTVASAPVPPFQLSALSFGIGGLVGVVWLFLSGGFGKLRRVPLSAYAFGTAGLFGYHFLYFTALRMAPAAEAGLISYLWPLFIVLFSGLMPGETLRRGHVAGAVVAFLGAALIVASGVGAVSGAVSGALAGYGVAFLAALTWAGYSLGSRWMKGVPTGAVAIFCLATALLSALAHLALETPAWPQGTMGWLAIATAPAEPAPTIDGASVWIDPTTLIRLFPVTADAAGYAETPLPIPAIPALAGTRFFAQTLWPDPCRPGEFGATSGLRIRIRP